MCNMYTFPILNSSWNDEPLFFFLEVWVEVEMSKYLIKFFSTLFLSSFLLFLLGLVWSFVEDILLFLSFHWKLNWIFSAQWVEVNNINLFMRLYLYWNFVHFTFAFLKPIKWTKHYKKPLPIKIISIIDMNARFSWNFKL